MACDSKQNTLDHLRQKEILDDFFRIQELTEFERLNKVYGNHAKSQYGLSDIGLPFTLQKVKTKAQLGHNYHRDNFIEYYRAVPNDIFFNAVDNYINQEQEDFLDDPLDFYTDFLNTPGPLTTVVQPRYEKYIQYKENLVRRLERRLGLIGAAKKKNSNNAIILKGLTKLENNINHRIDGSQELDIIGLKEEIADLRSAPVIEKFLFYVDNDFKRLQELENSDDYEEMKEARTIINFYKEVGNFDSKEEHPIFTNDVLYDANKKITLDDTVYEALVQVKEAALYYGNKIEEKERKAILEIVNSNPKAQETFGTDRVFTYEELFYTKDGLKDASWLDMFIMDATNGIFSENGILPQVMMTEIQHSFERHLVYAKSIENQLTEMQPRVEAALTALGYGLNLRGITGVSYELFQAKDANGQRQDAITQRYTPSFADEKGRMYEKLNRDFEDARLELDPDIRKVKYRLAYKNRDQWHRKHTIILDVRKIPEIITDPAFASFSQFFNSAGSAAYQAEIENILGPQGYQEEIDKQKKLLKDYQTMLDVTRDNLLDPSGNLSPDNTRKLEMWVKRNNPFIASQAYETQQDILQGRLKLDSTMTYNYSIPRQKKANLLLRGRHVTVQETNDDTGFYDDAFKTIEANPDLKEFHNLFMELQEVMFDQLPPEVRKKFNANSFGALEKSLFEIGFDPNTPFFLRAFKTFRAFWEKLKGFFGENLQNNLSFANIDPITGQPDYQVSDAFLQANKREINDRYFVELQRMKAAFNLPATAKVGRFQRVNLAGNPQAVKILTEALGIKNDLAELQRRLSNEDLSNLELGRVLKSAIAHQVVSEKSTDLPKLMKMYSYMTMEYAARQEVLPYMEIMKGHYEQIKAAETTNFGESILNMLGGGETRMEGERKKAKLQMKSWFKRAILGDYGSKNEFGDTQIKTPGYVGFDPDSTNSLQAQLHVPITGRIMTAQQKEMYKKLPEIKDKLNNIITNSTDPEEIRIATKQLNRILSIERNLGKRFTIKATFDAIFNFIRLKGLGWNLPSYVTNFSEGQIANFMVAATGDYFPPENIYRATNIMKESFLKNLSFGKIVTKEAKKTRILMDRYRILQDASNELQKASSKSAFSRFNRLEPYEGTRRTEYLNQAPLMISTLVDVEVTDENGGNPLNVFDAMDENGKLLPPYRTQENIVNWEKAGGDRYNSYKSHIIKTIVNAHGDYDTLRGNMASELILGKAALMFKRWLSRQLWQRFAVTQTDIEIGSKEMKGWYRSHTKVSATLHGALLGFGGLSLLSAGVPGLLVGGAAGYIVGARYGIDSQLSVLKQAAIIGKQLFMNYLRIPINTIAGKPVLQEGNYEAFKDNKFTERDMRNLRAVMVDMSLQLMWIGLLLFTKALFWDDEDKRDSPRRRVHNVLANQFMKFASQAAMYSNPVEMWTNITEMAIIRFFTDVGKTLAKAKGVVEGDDILPPGSPDAGKSAFATQFKKTFYPGAFKQLGIPSGDNLPELALNSVASVGFENQMRRQWRPSPFDRWFWSDDKKAKRATSQIRAQYQRQLLDSGMSEEAAKKATKKKYRYKKRKESYQDLLRYYETVE